MESLPFDTAIVSRSLTETETLAEKVYRLITPSGFIALRGPLGAGKTTFVRGFAKAAGCNTDDVSSPTFTIINEYHGGETPLFHFDLYRLGDASEFYAIGGDEYLERTGIILMEWPENGEECLPDSYIDVRIEIVDAISRQFTFTRVGQ
ncbi:MAG: tRNA (adenosine(37)-N6)-threonylcarbamoyltransferase complex ATPase subunit type 1 TsaE [Candidatus Zixiibacteriota bacterium]